MFIEMLPNIGKNHKHTQAVRTAALGLGVQVAADMQFMNGVVLIRLLDGAELKVRDIPEKIFEQMEGVAKIIAHDALGY